MFNSGEVLWCDEVDIVFLGVNFSHSLLFLYLSTDGMLSRLHDATLRDTVYATEFMMFVSFTRCVRRLSSLVTLFHPLMSLSFLISYTLSGVKVALLLRPRSQQF
jgi:hypothetical protein